LAVHTTRRHRTGERVQGPVVLTGLDILITAQYLKIDDSLPEVRAESAGGCRAPGNTPISGLRWRLPC
jgi:hypothetical protein